MINNANSPTHQASFLMQYAHLVPDTNPFYQRLKQESVAFKRDGEYQNVLTRPGETPTHPSHFRTFAPPYTSAYYIQRLVADKNEDLMAMKEEVRH